MARVLSGSSTAPLAQSSSELHGFFILTEKISTAVREKVFRKAEAEAAAVDAPSHELGTKPEVSKKRVGGKSRIYERDWHTLYADGIDRETDIEVKRQGNGS